MSTEKFFAIVSGFGDGVSTLEVIAGTNAKQAAATCAVEVDAQRKSKAREALSIQVLGWDEDTWVRVSDSPFSKEYANATQAVEENQQREAVRRFRKGIKAV